MIQITNQNSLLLSGTGGRQPSIIYAAIQSMPQIISHRNGQVDSDEKTSPAPLETTEKPRDLRKPHSKLEEPSEDKSKDTKAKLYSHFKQSLPKLQPVHNVEILNKHDTFAIDTELTGSTGEIATMRNVIVHPYATIIDEEKDLKAEQSEEPYIVYDKQDYLKLKNVKKTVKTHKIGDEKKSVYPKEEIRSVPTGYKEKDDLETDNTIWIGYGLGVQPYRYRYNDASYPYGRPYSGWTRGYTGYPYYDNYRTRFLQSGYTGLSYDSNNNYGTGFGPYGVY